jgi:hypothetical protein
MRTLNVAEGYTAIIQPQTPGVKARAARTFLAV